MTTSNNNYRCQCMQNVFQKCKVKVAKSHFIILWRFGVIEEKPLGGGGEKSATLGIHRVKISFERILETSNNQGVAAALFSSRYLKNC